MNQDSIRKLRWVGRVLLALYLACLVYFMFFSESYGRTDVSSDYRYNLVLFQEIRRFLRYRDVLGTPAVLINVLGNVVLFIPYGFSLPLLFARVRSFLRMAILSFGTSLLAETLQLFFRVGCFDVDDLLLNTVGGCIGYLLFRVLWRRVQDKTRG